MEADIKWLIGILITVVGSFALMLIGTFRNLSTKWTTSTAALHKKIEDGDKDTNAKIDDVKERYVRRDDLNDHIGRLDKVIKEVRDEQKSLGDEQRAQHLKVLEAISSVAGQR
jgi:hypothetical protein